MSYLEGVDPTADCPGCGHPKAQHHLVFAWDETARGLWCDPCGKLCKPSHHVQGQTDPAGVERLTLTLACIVARLGVFFMQEQDEGRRIVAKSLAEGLEWFVGEEKLVEDVVNALNSNKQPYGASQMANTLNAYPTDLLTPSQILLTRFSSTPAPVNEQVHACYQILGVVAANVYPDGASPTPSKDIWDRPDGMKAKFVGCPIPSDEEARAALEEACKMRGPLIDWLKTGPGKALVQFVLTALTTLLLS